MEDIKSNAILVEMKSIDPRATLDEAKSIHVGQVQQQLGLIRDNTKWKPYFGIIIYVDASFLDSIKVFVVEYDPAQWRVAKQRADMMMNADDASELRPEGKIAGGCDFCKWQEACAIATVGSMPANEGKNDELLPDDKDRFLDLISREREINAKMKELKEEQAEIKEDIKDEFIRLDRRYVNIEEDGRTFKASWSTRKGSKRFVQKLAEEAGIDLEPFKVQGEATEQFKVEIK